ncbi:phosphatase PAP2 family protein [Microbacterium rhizomatis]|uniref:Phosphatase PAP2 family protein n=1 Tax=Microbacterium rhizomatis TaxID=1631477 RepID=A0A5J5IZI3_9MICO|nr:phosphatase PAP2 family protein [Microbacterium rhizomatis]KAA9107655.1 phosphatase PAP2 family protein [Microbacterium rhizomatis]
MDAPARLTRRTELWVGGVLLAAAVALGAWIFVLRGNRPFAIDSWWNQLLFASRNDALLAVSYAMNWLGGGWFGIIGMPVIVVCLLLILRRPWSAVYFIVAIAGSALFVQVLKHSFGRARPEDIVVVSDYGSFPSGHVANATTIVVALFVIFPRVWVAIVGAAWVVVMAFSRTYLGAHWLSDTVGGALAGAAAALLMAAAFGTLLARERDFRMRRPVPPSHSPL